MEATSQLNSYESSAQNPLRINLNIGHNPFANPNTNSKALADNINIRFGIEESRIISTDIKKG